MEAALFVEGRAIEGVPIHTIFTRNAHVQNQDAPLTRTAPTSQATSTGSRAATAEENVVQELDGRDSRSGLELLSDTTLDRLAAERAAAAEFQQEDDASTRTLDDSLFDDLPTENRVPPAPAPVVSEEELEIQEGLSSVQEEWVAKAIGRLKKEIERFKKPKLYKKGYFKIQAPVQPEASSNASSTRVNPDSLVLMDIFVWLPLHLNGRPAGGFVCPKCKKGHLISHGTCPCPFKNVGLMLARTGFTCNPAARRVKALFRDYLLLSQRLLCTECGKTCTGTDEAIFAQLARSTQLLFPGKSM